MGFFALLGLLSASIMYATSGMFDDGPSESDDADQQTGDTDDMQPRVSPGDLINPVPISADPPVPDTEQDAETPDPEAEPSPEIAMPDPVEAKMTFDPEAKQITVEAA